MSDSQPTQVSSVEELLAATQLVSIQYYELSGLRFDGFDYFDDAPEQDPHINQAQMKLMQRTSDDTLAVRSRAEVTTPEGRLIADVAAVFKVTTGVAVSKSIAMAFAQRVASPIVRPYLREGIQSTAVRLGITAPLLAPLDHDGHEVPTP